MTQSIWHIHANNQGKVSDKWSSYLTYYDQLFAHKKHLPVNLLEIGVQNGGSLQTWAKYFTNAHNIIGCDIDEQCRQLTYEDPRIHLIVADCNSLYTYQQVTKHAPQLDIVIDDGSHKSVDIINCFVTYFQILNPGGIYVVEDTHTLYWQSWGGELTNGHNAYILFKKLIDVINHQFWDREMSLEQYLSDFFHPARIPEFITQGWIESIEFRNSLIVIRKAAQPSTNGLGDRIITGTQALVNHHVMEHKSPRID